MGYFHGSRLVRRETRNPPKRLNGKDLQISYCSDCYDMAGKTPTDHVKNYEPGYWMASQKLRGRSHATYAPGSPMLTHK